MSGENIHRGLFANAVEAGRISLFMGRRLGGMVVSRAAEAYTGKPPADQPHIAERVQATMPVNEAMIGLQMVEIGDLVDPDSARTQEQARQLAEKRRGYHQYGHYKIVKAALDADSDPLVQDEAVQEVIDIAHQAGTDPARLESPFSEFEVERAKHIIDPWGTE